MNRTLQRHLPGFQMFRGFFDRLGEDFKPVKAADAEKRHFLKALKMLGGTSAHEFRQLRDDLELTARVRDVRRRGEDEVYVRFDFRRMERDGRFGLPLQLMVLFNGHGKIRSYTVLRERGELEGGVRYAMTTSKGPAGSTEDLRTALSFLQTEPTGEVGIEDAHKGPPFLRVHAGWGPDGAGYDIVWHLGCAPWILTVRNVDFACVTGVLDALNTGGVKALEEAADWEQFDFIGDYREHGVLFEIDRELHRFLARARRDGDKMVEESIRAVGIGNEQGGDPCEIRIPYEKEANMLSELFNRANPNGTEGTEEQRVRLAAYLALRNHTESMHNFGWRFHFGRGVPVDYPKAIFWQEKSAARGDACSMQNLGVIYSEKTSPVHDCVKARAWFEKAVAAGNTWAMENLAFCLLCGENGKDVDRAVQLAKRAHEANPDLADFRETYERALNEQKTGR